MLPHHGLDRLTDLALLDSAASAVRNLNDHEIMGRKLRVDFSNEGPTGGNDDPSNDRNQSSNANSYNAPPANGTDNSMNSGGPLPPLPAGITLPQGVSVTDHISRTLNTLPPTQLLDILTSFKQLCATDPARATELLTQAPQLSYAIFQALLLMGLVSPEAINAVLEPGSVPPPAAGFPPAPGGYPGATNTPPVGGPAPGGYAPPPPPPVAVPTPVAQPAAAPVAAAAAAPGQESPDALLQQVLSLPEDVVQQLPETERVQIMQLRAQFGVSRA